MQRFVYKQLINIRIKHMIDGLKTFVVGLLVFVVASIIVVQPRFVGYDCNTTSAPQLAKYEYQLSNCAVIKDIF